MSDKTLGVVVTPLYATSEPPTQAPMPDDRGSMRVTAVDGGIKIDNIAAAAKAGADTFVAGSAIFGAPDYRATIARMRAELAAVR